MRWLHHRGYLDKHKKGAASSENHLRAVADALCLLSIHNRY